MKKFCRKGHLKRSGKRWLALLMSVCLIGTMIPITARAENGSTETGLCEHHTEHTTECGYVAPAWGHECGHVHDESCGYQEASECNHVHTEECGENGENCAHVHTSECSYAEEQACSHVHDEECGYVESSEGSPCTFVCDICGKEAEPGENNLPDETLTQTLGKLITAWQWIDEEGILDEETGNLALPGANAQTPAYFEDVTAFLPTQIQATVEEDTEAEAANKTITLGEWSCDSYPEEGAYQGYYTFAAALPEGYALSEEAEALEVLVELGGAQMYENSITATQPSVGDGCENNPYQISTAAELYWFAALVNGDTTVSGVTAANKTACAELMNDITVNENVLKEDGTPADNTSNFRSWTPIGNSNNQYTGTFDGQGHTISGLYFFNTSTEYVGLFGLVVNDGSVSNVGVVDSYFKGKKYVGGVCALNYCGTITNCYNTGAVSGTSYVGGVCGFNNGGTIENCYNTGTVIGGSGNCYCFGGVCGRNYAAAGTATITNCYNTGAVSGTGHYVGGVCGQNEVYNLSNGTATITNCYNRGTVSGSGNLVGGVCGQNKANNSPNGTATITNCYNTGNVTATGTDNDYVGGVCGENNATNSGTATITNCYNTGNVTATDYVGGVCGYNSAAAGTATITNCYNTGAVSGTGDYFGGVCGSNSTATITYCYYLANTADENGGKTEKQFKNGLVCYLLNGSTSTNPVWYQTLDSDSYPLLNSSHGTVYACTPCTGVFSNTSGQTAEHSCVVDTNDNTKHICENCGESHNAEFTANDETNTISVCCNLGSVTLKAPTELTYDGTAKAATVEGELTGIETPKILYKEKDSAEAAVETAPTNAGTYVASITYTIGKNTTYSVSVEYTIGKASVTVTAKDYIVKFGNPLPESLEYETDGLMGTDTLSSIGANVTIGYKNAVTPSAIGNYIIVVSGEAATTNYTLNYVNGKLTIIEKPAQTITANDVTLSYGDTGKKIGAATSGDGAISYAVASGDDVIRVATDGTITALKAGTATVEITAAETFDYAKATKTVTVTVNKKKVAVPTADSTEYTYNGKAQTYGVVSTDDYTVTGGTQTDAGNYPITITLNNENFEWDGVLSTYTFIIKKAAVTITANSYTVKVGNTLPKFDYKVSGLVNNEALPITVTVSCTAADSKTAGEYPITVSGAADSTNYTFNYVDGTLTITLKDIQTITAADVTLTYGDAGKKIGATTNGDGAITYSVKTGADVITLAADGTITTLKAGTATVEITAVETDDYAEATKTVTVTVNKAAVTIKADDKTVYQNAALPTFTYSVTGLANGDKLSFTPVLTCEATTTSTVGTYAITVTIEITEDECYTYTTTNGNLTVQKKSSGGSSGGGGGYRPTTPTEPNNPSIGGSAKSWSDVAADLGKLTNGSEATIELNGSTSISVDVIKAIADKDSKVTFVINSVFSWVVDGSQITTPVAADLTLTKTTSTKSNSLRGIEGTQFKINNTNIPTNLEIAFKSSHAGKFANLYKNVDGKLQFVTCAKLGEDGKVILTNVTEKGDYVAMLCEFSDRPGDMDNDGIINPKDSLAVLKNFLDIEKGANPLVSDVNKDGFINPKDALIILEKFLGIE